MKNEHELLKEIIDLIGYKLPKGVRLFGQHFIFTNLKYKDGGKAMFDIRIIIFSPEFMDKYITYLIENTNGGDDTLDEIARNLLYRNLNNPVEYLASLLDINQN